MSFRPTRTGKCRQHLLGTRSISISDIAFVLMVVCRALSFNRVQITTAANFTSAQLGFVLTLLIREAFIPAGVGMGAGRVSISTFVLSSHHITTFFISRVSVCLCFQIIAVATNSTIGTSGIAGAPHSFVNLVLQPNAYVTFDSSAVDGSITVRRLTVDAPSGFSIGSWAGAPGLASVTIATTTHAILNLHSSVVLSQTRLMTFGQLNITCDTATSSILLYNSSSITVWSGMFVVNRYLGGPVRATVNITSVDNAKEKLVFVGSPQALPTAVALVGTTGSGFVPPLLRLNLCVNSTGPTGNTITPTLLPSGVTVVPPSVGVLLPS